VGVYAVSCALFVTFAVPVPSTPPDADEAAVVRRLVEALKDPDFEVRQNLALALAKIGPPSVEPLVEALKDPLPERRAAAAYALALIGPPARAALPALLKALDDKDVDVRRQASYAISRLVPVGRTALRPTLPSTARAPGGKP
jgi:hypothetical protein